MAKRKKHIIKNSNHPSNQEWMKYLRHELSEEEAHDLEASILDDEFEWDAMDGLEQLSKPEDIGETLNEIKQNVLKKASVNKYPRRPFNYMAETKWGLYAIVIIIMVILLTIIIIHFLRN